MDFGKLGEIQKYTKRPKRENERTFKSSGPARSNFASHSGGFKGNMSHTVFVNSQNIGGVGNKGRSSAFCDYITREKEAISIYGDKEQAKKAFKEVEDKILPKRANSVIQCRLVIQLPREFLNNPDANLQKLCKSLDDKYFASSGAFLASLHAGGKDFKNPHLHIVFSNRTNDLKNIREYNNKDFLTNIKKDVAQFITQQVGVKCGVSQINKQSRHYPRWVTEAFKRAQKDPTGGTLKKYIEKYPIFKEFADEQAAKVNNRKIAVREQRIKSIVKEEISVLDKTKEKIEKRAGGFIGKLYTKKEKDEIKEAVDEIEKDKQRLNQKLNEPDFAALERERLMKIEREIKAKTPDPKKTIAKCQNPNPEKQKEEEKKMCNFLKEENPKTQGPSVQGETPITKDLKPKPDIIEFSQKPISARIENAEKINIKRMEDFKKIFPEAKWHKDKKAWVISETPENRKKLREYEIADKELLSKIPTPAHEPDAFSKLLEEQEEKKRKKGLGR